VDLIIFSLESITIHTVAGVQLLALLHYIELQFRNSRPIHVPVVNPYLYMASAYDLSFVLKFVKIFVLKFFFGCAQACIVDCSEPSMIIPSAVLLLLFLFGQEVSKPMV